MRRLRSPHVDNPAGRVKFGQPRRPRARSSWHKGDIDGGIGNTNFDLWAAGHRPQNFYMLGSMGLAFPIALASGLSNSSWAADEEDFERLIEQSLVNDGPTLIGVRIDASRAPARPAATPFRSGSASCTGLACYRKK